MHARGHIVAAIALTGLSACQEPPSYRLRWSIEGRGIPTTNACAESGLFQVRARAYVTPNDEASELVFPCAAAALEDPDALVDGATLSPGRYAIELRGIDRNGEPWNDPSLAPLDPNAIHNGCNAINDYTECRPTELVCDCLALEVREDAVVDLPEFVLTAPPECVDGIDNDRDGFVDANDAACGVDGGVGGEGIPVGLTELRVALSFLSHNPFATCGSVGVTDFQVRVDDGSGPQVVLDTTCNVDQPYLLSLRLPAGTYGFSTVALDRPQRCDHVDEQCAVDRLTAAQCVGDNPECFADSCPDSLASCADLGLDDDQCAAAHPECHQSGLLTTVEAFESEIRASGGSIVAAVDFAAEDFLVPIDERISFAPLYVDSLGIEGSGGDGAQPVRARASCGAASTPGHLEIAGLRIQMLNAHGGALDTPVVVDGTPLDGSERPCAPVFLTESVPWGGYAAAIDAVSAEGEVCFSNVDAPAPMRPTDTLGVPLPRVYEQTVDGDGVATYEVPVSCRDCDTDGDCGGGDAWACLAGVCQLPCTIDRDCESVELGDLGFECTAVDGRSERYCQLATP